MLDRMTQGRWLWSLGCLSLCVPLSGCMKRSISAADESALPREGRDAPQPAALKNFLKDKEVKTTPGLFVTYSYRTKTYMLVQGKQLGKPFLMTLAVSQGTGRRGSDVLGGLCGVTGTGIEVSCATLRSTMTSSRCCVSLLLATALSAQGWSVDDIERLLAAPALQ